MNRCAPGIVSSYAHLTRKYANPGILRSGKFIRMGGILKFIGTVRKKSQFEGSFFCRKKYTASLIVCKPCISDLGAVAAFLRYEIRCEIVCGSTPVKVKRSSVITVPVVLKGALAQIFHVLKFAVNLKLPAKQRKDGTALAAFIFDVYLNPAVGLSRITYRGVNHMVGGVLIVIYCLHAIAEVLKRNHGGQLILT